MKSELLHNLPEFIERNDITTAFGAVVAVAHANEDNVASFFNQLNLVHFYAVFLLIDGYAEVTINDKTIRLEHPANCPYAARWFRQKQQRTRCLFPLH